MKPSHILTGINIYGIDFPTKTNELIKELAKDFNLENLELSEDGIIKLEQQFEKIWEENDGINFTNKYFLSLIAYLGEVFINTNGGNWHMYYDRESNIWEPQIRFEKKVFYHFIHLYDTLSYDEFPSFWACYISKSFVNEWFVLS
jgi:hypothetical protein